VSVPVLSHRFLKIARFNLGFTTLCVAISSAEARPIRRLFEPTDLEFGDPGVAELDLQVGALRGSDAFRVAVPDAELNIGLTKQLELDVDGAFSLEGPNDGALKYDHLATDNTWLSLKAGLWSLTDKSRRRITSCGLQIGPKLPTARGSSGLGLEELVLVGFALPHTHVILNAGGLLDPSSGATGRPRAIEGGIDFDQDLDSRGIWSLGGELGAVHFLSNDPQQIHVASGITWSSSEVLSLSATGLVGLSRGSDRYGLLLGIAPKLRWFGVTDR
jgi:hypothetical protein